jgi:hypothetical protein
MTLLIPLHPSSRKERNRTAKNFIKRGKIKQFEQIFSNFSKRAKGSR